MRVRVDDAKCQGHTLCAMNAPQLFGLRDDDGHSYVLHEQVSPDEEEAARAASLSCPEWAIEIIEE
jgi:ferredoxin